MSEDIEKRIAQFVHYRDEIRAIEKKAEEDMKPLKEIRDRLEGILQAFMLENNVPTLKTPAGTCYTSTRRTASLPDPELFMKYVIENQAFDLLDRRANSTAVKAFVDEHKGLPPGCNLTTVTNVRVRRGGGKDDE